MNDDKKLELANSVYNNTKSLFTYVSDKENYDVLEDWRSHHKAVLENMPFEDDCDGFALTCGKLLQHYKVDEADILFFICKTENNVGHAVCGIQLSNDTYILDNRQYNVVHFKDLDYTWKRVTTFASKGRWYDVNEN